MALKIQRTSKLVLRPRVLLYSFPGAGKTTLASTLAEDGKSNILFAQTEGGAEAISHLDLPFVDIKTPMDYDNLIQEIKCGKLLGDGVVRMNGLEINGLVVDMFQHVIERNLRQLISEAKGVIDGTRSVDDSSEYEYKKLNLRALRLMDDLNSLPLKYIILTSWLDEKRSKDGVLETVRPKFGPTIWQTVAGNMMAVFPMITPDNPKDALVKRIIYTQPHPIYYAKFRIPGMVGALPVPAKLDYKLGHPNLLKKIFDTVQDFVEGKRKLKPVGEVPAGIEATPENPDPESVPQEGKENVKQ